MKLYFVTVATHSSNYYESFIQSCKIKNIDINILGWGEKYYGHHMKYDLMIKFTENKNPNDIVVSIDAFDSIIVEDSETIKNKFISTNKKLIVSSESIDKCSLIHHFLYRNYKKTNGKYLNTGMYIGYIGYVNKFLKNIKKFINTSNKDSNQQLWQDFVLSNPDSLYIDNKYLFITSSIK